MDTLRDSFEANLGTIEDESAALWTVAEASPTAPARTTPGWNVMALLIHTGGAHRWATANVQAAGGRVRRREIAAQRPADEATDQLKVDWFRAGATSLVQALRQVGPDGPAWSMGPEDSGQRAAWWARRMAQETAVHRWDAADAAHTDAHPAPSTIRGFPPARAAEGVDEYLCDFVPRVPAELFEGRGGTLHVHLTDTEGEWVVDLSQPGTPAEHRHAKADAAVRGPASDVLLWLWNRQPADGFLEVFGDQSLVDFWRQITL